MDEKTKHEAKALLFGATRILRKYVLEFDGLTKEELEYFMEGTAGLRLDMRASLLAGCMIEKAFWKKKGFVMKVPDVQECL